MNTSPLGLVLPDAETPSHPVTSPVLPQQHRSTLTPTPQQAAFLSALTDTDRNICLQARAGCGKTSAILMGVDAYLSRLPGAEVLVCAFNKSIQKEVADKLSSRGYDWRQVGCQTVHSMGMSLLKYAFRPQVDEHKVWGIIDALRLHEQRTHPLHVFGPTIKSLVGLAKQAGVGFFDESPIPAREVWYTIADHYDVDPFGDVDMDAVVTEAIKVYRTSLDCTEVIDFDDMVLFPLIKGLRVKFQKDLVLGDEVQDWSPIRAAIVKMYCKRGTGRIAIVGDDRQCHPPGTLIEVGKGVLSPIEQLKDGDTVRSWNRNAQKMISGRKIEIGQRTYTGRLLRISVGERDTLGALGGNWRYRSTRVTPNHRFLCRWSDRKSEVCVTYLMWREGFGFRVGWCKLFANGKTAQQISRTFHLAHRSRIEKADKCWILQVHDTRTGASTNESVIAGRYGLPTITFEPVNGAEHITTETIAQVFAALKDENTSRGFRCLHDHGREFALPLYPWPTMSEFNDKQGRRTYFEVYASNVQPELMSVPLPDSPNLWTPVTEVTSEIYSGPVYSLDVEEDHSYAADGIVVLNSIYGWSGADHQSMHNLTRELDAVTLPLSVTWRCPKRVVKLAQRIVPDLEAAPSAPEGEVLVQPSFQSRNNPGYDTARAVEQVYLEDLTIADAILCRNNAPLVPLCYRIIRAGIPARVEGRKIGEGLQELVNRWRVKTTSALRNKICDWRERETQKLSAKGKEQKAAEIEDRALTLLEIVAECEKRGRHDVESVIEFIDRLFGDDVKGAVTLSSYHKSKGREWDLVFLLEHSLRCPSKAARQEWQKVQESNLAYVAMTRARKTLVFVG